jgi:hypothetical protein
MPERTQEAEKEKTPMHVQPKEYAPSDFDEPPYLRKRRPEPQPEPQVEKKPARQVDIEEEDLDEMPFPRLERDEILPSIFGDFK